MQLYSLPKVLWTVVKVVTCLLIVLSVLLLVPHDHDESGGVFFGDKFTTIVEVNASRLV